MLAHAQSPKERIEGLAGLVVRHPHPIVSDAQQVFLSDDPAKNVDLGLPFRAAVLHRIVGEIGHHLPKQPLRALHFRGLRRHMQRHSFGCKACGQFVADLRHHDGRVTNPGPRRAVADPGQREQILDDGLHARHPALENGP